MKFICLTLILCISVFFQSSYGQSSISEEIIWNDEKIEELKAQAHLEIKTPAQWFEERIDKYNCTQLSVLTYNAKTTDLLRGSLWFAVQFSVKNPLPMYTKLVGITKQKYHNGCYRQTPKCEQFVVDLYTYYYMMQVFFTYTEKKDDYGEDVNTARRLFQTPEDGDDYEYCML